MVRLRRLEQTGDLLGVAGKYYAMRQAVRRTAGIGDIRVAHGCTFGKLHAIIAQGRDENGPAGAVPARGIGLLARDTAQGVGSDRAGADGAGLNGEII